MLKQTRPALFAVIYDMLIVANGHDTDDQQEARDLVEAVKKFTMSDVRDLLADLDPECPTDAKDIATIKRAMR